MAKGRFIRCRVGEKRFTVVRVNRNTADTFAARSFEQAMEMAQPDRGSRIDVFRVCAGDAGEARLPSVVSHKGVRVRGTFRYKGR